MEFVRSIPLQGDPDRLLELALRILASNGFRLTAQGTDFVEFEGGGMNSREPSVLGASRMRIEAQRGEARLRAQLDGLKRIRNLLLVLPLGLGLFFVVLFLWLFGDLDRTMVLMLALAPVAPWLVLTPLLMRWIRRRTERALDTLLHNLVTATEGDGGRKE